ncbi:MAG: lipid II flippase MurJ [Corynebacterium sp.]|nr:lipid II flippase MurJ [Corynebacterium sp.]
MTNRQGTRARIVKPRAPMPLPTAETKQHLLKRATTGTPATTTPVETTNSDADVVKDTGSMAVATLVSRITGFLRQVAVGATLGPIIASTFNTANTLPNLITEIVLGAVLTALVVPVLVRAEKEDADHGELFIRRLFTLTITLLGAVTVLAVVLAPLLSWLTIGTGTVSVPQTTAFAYLLLPQIFFYGVFSLFLAIANTKGVFRPGAWAPVINNLVCLATFALYWLVPGTLGIHEARLTNTHVLILGLGTTLGVVIQAAVMLPALRRLRISLRPAWGLDPRLKQFGWMALAIVVYVAISQFGYMVTLRIASAAAPEAPNVYQQAWLLLQMPYGIIGVTLLTAIMPRLSRNAADGDTAAVVRDLGLGTRLTFMAMIPIVIFCTAFGPHIGRSLYAWGRFDGATASLIGITVSMSAFSLLPYAAVLLHLRVFYAREEAWTPTYIIGGITATKVILSLLAPLVAPAEWVAPLLGLANGLGFVAGALIGAILLKRKLGSLGGGAVGRSSVTSFGASLVGALVAVGVDRLVLTLFRLVLGTTAGDPAVATDSPADATVVWLIRTMVAGIVFLAVTGVIIVKAEPEFVRHLLRRGTPTDEELAQAQAAELSALLTSTLSHLPPMSAGEVARPVLVPGAPILSGQFRLIAHQFTGPVVGGFSPASGAAAAGLPSGAAAAGLPSGASSDLADLWLAQDTASKATVALLFTATDPTVPSGSTGAPAPTASQGSAGTTRPADSQGSAGAPAPTAPQGSAGTTRPADLAGITVVPYRAGYLAIAEWPQKTVTPTPIAQLLGLDTEVGSAEAATGTDSPTASAEAAAADESAAASSAEPTAASTSAVGEDANAGAAIWDDLRIPESTHGFGGRGYSNWAKFLIAGLVTALVITIVILTTVFINLLLP